MDIIFSLLPLFSYSRGPKVFCIKKNRTRRMAKKETKKRKREQEEMCEV
jgi:hypothetical protein